MAAVCRAQEPVAVTTCSQVMLPLSVCTFHSPEGSCLMSVTLVWR